MTGAAATVTGAVEIGPSARASGQRRWSSPTSSCATWPPAPRLWSVPHRRAVRGTASAPGRRSARPVATSRSSQTPRTWRRGTRTAWATCCWPRVVPAAAPRTGSSRCVRAAEVPGPGDADGGRRAAPHRAARHGQTRQRVRDVFHLQSGASNGCAPAPRHRRVAGSGGGGPQRSAPVLTALRQRRRHHDDLRPAGAPRWLLRRSHHDRAAGRSCCPGSCAAEPHASGITSRSRWQRAGPSGAAATSRAPAELRLAASVAPVYSAATGCPHSLQNRCGTGAPNSAQAAFRQAALRRRTRRRCLG